jgi:hypothetical protein
MQKNACPKLQRKPFVRRFKTVLTVPYGNGGSSLEKFKFLKQVQHTFAVRSQNPCIYLFGKPFTNSAKRAK